MQHENEFVSFLISEKTIKSEKAVQSRISKARRAMKILSPLITGNTEVVPLCDSGLVVCGCTSAVLFR